jgi:MFS transporter, SP family, sugar:H+ symporter
MVALTSAISGLSFGYEIGIIDTVLQMNSFEVYFSLLGDDSALRVGDIVSLFLIGCVFGTVAVSDVADRLGRKYSILLGALIFATGGLLQAFTVNFAMLLSSRFISGLSIGILSMIAPLYISEISPTNIRGSLISIQQLAITLGILFASIVNAVLFNLYQNRDDNTEWRLALGIQSIPGFLLFGAMWFLPESPRILLVKGKGTSKKALEVIAYLYQMDETSKSVQEEYARIVHDVCEEYGFENIPNGERETLVVEKSKEVDPGGDEEGVNQDTVPLKSGSGLEVVKVPRSAWSLYWDPWRDIFLVPSIRYRAFVVTMLQFFQQWSGINVILYYAGALFQDMGFSKSFSSTYLVIINAFILVATTLPSIYLIESPRGGRRLLLLVGAFLMSLCHTCITIGLVLVENVSPSFAYLAITFVFLFTSCFSLTWGGTVWTVQSEVFPMHVRSKASSLGTISNWINNAIIAKISPLLISLLGPYIYLIFAVVCFIGGIFTYLLVPETRNVSLEDMNELFQFSRIGCCPRRTDRTPIHFQTSSYGT